MTTGETVPVSISTPLPIDWETQRQFAEMYRWQNWHGVDIRCRDTNSNTGFGLSFCDGEDYPTYKLEVWQEDMLQTVRFSTYSAGGLVLIAPVATDKQAPKPLTEEEVQMVSNIIPAALEEWNRLRLARRPRRSLISFLLRRSKV